MTREEKIDNLIENVLPEREQHYVSKRTAAAQAEHAYRIKKSIEFSTAIGSNEVRNHLSVVASDEELLAREVANAESDIAFQLLQDARQALTAHQSLLRVESNKPF